MNKPANSGHRPPRKGQPDAACPTEQTMETDPDAAACSAAVDSPKIRSAADAVHRARLEFEKAQQVYDEVRREAVERIEKVRETTVGDLIEGTLDAVRKRPAVGLGIAALIGFFLGRLFRR
ncbi:MAG TPA: hypothetical protein DD670_01485 [Planctomycetaceae bacterium]|nr:hypothetical protein [Planctomycetaceae bacterium]